MTTAIILVAMGVLCAVLLLHLPRRQSPAESARARVEMLVELEADLLEELQEARAPGERARLGMTEGRVHTVALAAAKAPAGAETPGEGQQSMGFDA